MFLPIGDRPNPAETPWVTWTLIAVNIGIHLALWPLEARVASIEDPVARQYLQVLHQERGVFPEAISEGDLFRFEHGIKPAAFDWADAFTAMFLHAGFAHLLGNMLFLWIFGDNIEHRLGRWKFLLAYLGTGLAATCGDTLLRMGSSVPSVGASGAISGVLGLYFLWFPQNRVRVFVFLFPFWMEVIELSARFVLGMYLVVNNLLPLLLSGGAGGVSYGAHIGGFLAGWGLAWSLGGDHGRLSGPMPRGTARAAGEAWKRFRARAESRDGRARVDDFRIALAAGRPGTAAEVFFRLPRSLTRSAFSVGEKVALGEALEQERMGRAALAAYQRALADHPSGPQRARAHLGAARVLLRQLGSPTAAYQHLYSAREESPSPAELAHSEELLAELGSVARSVPRAR